MSYPTNVNEFHSEASSFSFSNGSTSSSPSKTKYRVRIDLGNDSSNTRYHAYNEHESMHIKNDENVDDDGGSISSSTRSSGSPPPIDQLRRNRTISGSKSEDHMFSLPSGQVNFNDKQKLEFCKKRRE